MRISELAQRTGVSPHALRIEDMVDAMRGRIAEIDRELAALQAQRAEVLDHIQWLRKQKRNRKEKS